MLQPSQLEDVSVRYADEIAEMREFFTTAGTSVGKPQTLVQVVQRLREDRGFHRDLTLHVGVMLHRRGLDVRYGETLGVVALAAAGKHLAADADEHVAHDLLRFVMEAHDGLNPPAQRSAPASLSHSLIAASPVPTAAAEEPAASAMNVVKTATVAPITQFPALSAAAVKGKEEASTAFAEVAMPRRTAQLLPDTPIQLSRVDAETADDTRRRSFVWVALAAALVLAVLAGWWFYRNTSSAPDAVATPAPVIEGNANAAPAPEVAVVKRAAPIAAPIKPLVIAETSHPQRSAVHLHRRPAPVPQTHIVSPATRTAPASRQQVASVAPPPAAISRPSAAASAPGTSSSAPVVRPSANTSRPTAPAIVSAGTLSKQLDRPGLSKEQEAEYDNTGHRYPRLLRRTPLNNNVLLAQANVPPPLGAANASAGSAPAGTVRPTSLGVMASNLIYSPAAAYPAAASVAHVEGAVKVEAVVDTSGNVAAARVISGPVQLRDAALNAVQQWRYKPYVLGGKARTFTTQALMEFELP